MRREEKETDQRRVACMAKTRGVFIESVLLVDGRIVCIANRDGSTSRMGAVGSRRV